jgi:DNA-binding NarL/FixJ family response regulator
VNGYGLTPREFEVAKLVACGLTNKEVARKLGVTESVVKQHLHKILESLAKEIVYAA